MTRPTSRASLLDAADTEMARLLDEVEQVPPAARLTPGACEDWSVKDLLAHLHAWHEMFLSWEAEGSSGGDPAIPAPGYSWKTTPALNDAIWRRTRDDDYDDVITRLAASHARVRSVIEGYGDDLFEARRYRWTGSTSVGAYAVSATSSHYAWATKLIRRYRRHLGDGPATA